MGFMILLMTVYVPIAINMMVAKSAPREVRRMKLTRSEYSSRMGISTATRAITFPSFVMGSMPVILKPKSELYIMCVLLRLPVESISSKAGMNLGSMEPSSP